MVDNFNVHLPHLVICEQTHVEALFFVEYFIDAIAQLVGQAGMDFCN